jgi:hypothetical protein
MSRRDGLCLPSLRIDSISANLQFVGDPVKYITDDRGERKAVVLPIADYEKLLEHLEDLAVVAERREERTIPHEQFVSELNRDGDCH